MKKRVILTAFGKDKPGIVKSVTEVLYNADCNIEDSTMTQLCGNFAMMIAVVIPDDSTIEQLEEKLRKIGDSEELLIQIKPLLKPKEKPVKTVRSRCMLTVTGSDKPGIVYEVSKLLGNRDINIANINTRIFSDSDGDSYIMILELELPKQVKFSQLKFELSNLSERLEVEMVLDPMVSDSI